MNTRNLVAFIIGALALVITFGPSINTETDISTSPQGITFHTEANTFQPDPTPETVVQVAQQAPCGSDADCVTKFPAIIPDVNTIDAYRAVWGDNIQFPTEGDCTNVDWLALDYDGNPFVPVDLDNNGRINCDSDYELGA